MTARWTGGSMTDTDRFFAAAGKVMCVFGLVIVVILCVFTLSLLRYDYEEMNTPAYTIPPDSTPRPKK